MGALSNVSTWSRRLGLNAPELGHGIPAFLGGLSTVCNGAPMESSRCQLSALWYHDVSNQCVGCVVCEGDSLTLVTATESTAGRILVAGPTVGAKPGKALTSEVVEAKF